MQKGVHTVGVQRQYTGTAGRIENAQVAVHLTYATDAGHAFIDRALYLRVSWTDDADRRAAAGIPTGVKFATKPALATTMVARALDAGVKACWVAGDEVYGADPGLRAELESRDVGYVLAIGCNREVTTAAGRFRAGHVAQLVPRRAWQRYSCGDGAKGPGTTTGLTSTSIPTCLAIAACWCGVTTTPVNWPTTVATCPDRSRCRPW